MASVDVGAVSTAVMALLRAEMPVPVGRSRLPTPEEVSALVKNSDDRIDPKKGALVVNRVSPVANESDGYIGEAASMMTVRYQLTGVGVQPDQAEAIAIAACDVLAAKDGKSYVNDLTVADHVVMSRNRAGAGPDDSANQVHNSAWFVDIYIAVA